MKKTLLFFAIFFFCSVLSAEEAAADNRKNQESEQIGNSCPCNEYKAVKEPKKIYFSLALELDSFIVPFLGMDVGFLVKHTKRENNIYLGLGSGLKYSRGFYVDDVSYNNVLELPFHGHVAFDFKQKDCFLDYVSLRFFGGINLFFGQSEKRNEETHRYYRSYDGLSGFFPSAGIGLDLVFDVNVILRTGFLFENSAWPFPFIGLGYRF